VDQGGEREERRKDVMFAKSDEKEEERKVCKEKQPGG